MKKLVSIMDGINPLRLINLILAVVAVICGISCIVVAFTHEAYFHIVTGAFFILIGVGMVWTEMKKKNYGND